MQLERIVNKVFSSNTYIIHSKSSPKAWLIDCGDIYPILNHIKVNGLNPKSVLLTHAHFDHIYGLNTLLEINPTIKVYTNEYGKVMLLDARKNMSQYHKNPFIFKFLDNIIIVNNNDSVILTDDISAKALFTPGHNPSCITWVIGNALFTGDSYIPGVKTVTNLPGGNKVLAKASEELIKSLAANRTIYPGHDIQS